MTSSIESSAAALPEEIVEEFIAAVNSHDIDAILSMVTDDAHVAFAGLTPFVGTDRIGSYFGFFAGFRARWDYTITGSSDNVVSGTMEAHDQWSEAAGISPLRYDKFEFTILNGLVSRLETEFTSESNKDLSDLLEKFTPWAAARHPEFYDAEGDYVYTRATGEGMVTAIRDWVASDA